MPPPAERLRRFDAAAREVQLRLEVGEHLSALDGVFEVVVQPGAVHCTSP